MIKNKKGELSIVQSVLMEDIYQRTSESKIQINKTGKKIIAKIYVFYMFHTLKKVAKKIDYSKYIIVHNDICNGEAVIKGTRIRPITVYNYLVSNNKKYSKQEGLNLYFEDIKKAYPALNDEKTLYALLYCIRKISFKNCFK